MARRNMVPIITAAPGDRILRVTHFGKPSVPQPEFGDRLSPHRDMLRYDDGFHDPEQHDRIVLPVFKGPQGRSTISITKGRWDSFSCRLKPAGEEDPVDVSLWITYESEINPRPQTLREFMMQHGYTQIVGWRLP